MKPITEHVNAEWLQRLEPLAKQLHEEQDFQAEQIIRELIHKRMKQELVVAFCGHFSAGKSSLINKLCGKQVLPSSPLPTSANIVMIRNGVERAVLTSSDGSRNIEVPLQEAADYCRNGEDYTRVELWADLPFLGSRGVLLDTPGVDSNDAGHAMATHSALHLADVVFYVMDYNHVGSESNLTFAKTLTDYGKPLYMVVNQIDKHREEELPFDAYKRTVEQAFEVWNVKTAGIFYTSLKVERFPHNQLSALKGSMEVILADQGELLAYSTYTSAAQAVKDHLRRLSDEENEQREKLLEQAGGETDVIAMEAELERLQNGNGEDEESYRIEQLKLIGRMLDNAQLMTPTLRDLAGLYLESRSPGFKAKGWFAGGKTAAEKEKRSSDFLRALSEQTAAQVDWHVRTELRKIGQELELWDDEWEAKLDQWMPKAEESWITDALPSGAVVSGESTLRYAGAVAAGVTARFRRAAAEVIEALLAVPSPLRQRRQAAAAGRRAELEARLPAARRLAELDAAAVAREARFGALLGASVTLTSGLLPGVKDAAPPAAGAAKPGVPADGTPLAAPAGHAEAVPGAGAAPQHPGLVAARVLPPDAGDAEPSASEGIRPAGRAEGTAPAGGSVVHLPAAAEGGVSAPRKLRRRALESAARLEAAAGLLAPHPAFGTGVEELRKRAAELRRGRFTVALFGAFSAGKSSFANALLGAPVLPVSPHPTTAAIGRILAPEDGYAHETAHIQFKSAQAMEEDLAFSFSALQLGEWEPSGWLSVVKKLQADQIPAAGRAHFSFLKAAAAGWEDMSPKLGQSLVSDLEEFRHYAAEETKACFVASIDLYYSCPLTDQGVVLVDTPGADSIHARHTGVTFQYMKNSDAILFVTYYNHAFSRADKQFLAQLGRIKGSFALDKMFFIVNAADLAASEEELGQVVEHVRDGLKGAGISNPQVYALSSHQALKENSGGSLLFAALNKQDEEPAVIDSAPATGVLEASEDSRDVKQIHPSRNQALEMSSSLTEDAEGLNSRNGFARFSEQFSTFLEEDLSRLAAAAAAAELGQLNERLNRWISTAEQLLRNKEQQVDRIEQERKAFEAAVAVLKNADIRREWIQECEELLFHVVQRLRLQALDLFAEFFHPSLLQEGQGQMKRNFAIALKGWLDQTSAELERELLATSLRLERKGEQLLLREAEGWCRVNSPAFDMPLTAPAKLAVWQTVNIPEGLLGSEDMSPSAYWSYFKNPKSFFEGDGRSSLREALEKPLVLSLKKAVSEGEEIFKRHYLSVIAEKQEELAQYFLQLWKEWEDSIRNSGASEEDLKQWEIAALQLSRYCEEMEAFYK
ncbi:dynamin family protein [Paenibacillus physcomitrellae]|uniref:Dynamin N-terminal domain-containing protein n=1 Tax=Paenibacillus physcomitrellae TaxID=1619311 RepID=A0ABQ1FNN8_9BACL|nr:dynamin family protein [Paenibacillus physcomitrellae]GGA23707.1 hypothetical protein GCM10010917_05560 [Paenibacillus physcomitrellae]